MSCSSSMPFGNLIMRNSIKPSQTGNCTNISKALCEPSGLFNSLGNTNYKFLMKKNQPTVHGITEQISSRKKFCTTLRFQCLQSPNEDSL